ncbi:MAG: nitroreductase family protein [Bacilli bacterium]
METMEAINKRTSVRFFKETQITEEELNTILHAGKRAPIGMKKYGEMHITVIQNKEVLEKLDKAIQEYTGQSKRRIFHGAPTGILVSGKPTDYAYMEYDNGACIIENMILAATDLGLGNVYMKSIIPFLNDNPEHIKELGIPEDFIPLAGLAVGYPIEEMQREPKEHDIEVNII